MYFIMLTFFCLLLWKIPDSIWEKLGNPKLLVLNRRLTLTQSGQQTWTWMQTGQGEWPSYKFYGSFLSEMQKLIRLYGGSPKTVIESLKKPLLQDIRFETKLAQIRLGGIVQFISMILMTWVFIIVSRLILNRTFELRSLTVIATLQIIGLISFSVIEGWKRRQIFNGYDLVYEVMVTLIALLPIGISLKEKKEKSGVDRFLAQKGLPIELERVRRNLQKAILQWKDFGKPIEVTLNELLDDIRFAQEMAQAKLLKQMDAFKFLIAAVFFLPAYLFDLYLMVNSFFSLN